MPITKSELCRLIPHAGTMCLLDKVVNWDEFHIVCTTRTHGDLNNPLRSRGRLHALCGLEYAAQAMACHGGLLASQGGGMPFAQQGYLAGVRDLAIVVSRLDDIRDELSIRAERLIGDDSSLLYGFTVSAAGTDILQGRASVFFARALGI